MPSQGRLLWAHRDSSGNLAGVAADAYARAKAENWPTDPVEGNRLLRAWLVSQMATMANLGPRPTSLIREGDHRYDILQSELGPGARFSVDVRPSSRPDNLDWQTLIASGLCGVVGSIHATPQDPKGIAFLRSQMPKPGQVVRILTVDGEAPVIMPAIADPDMLAETGAITIIGGIVIVACVAAVAAAVAWVSSQIAEVTSVGLQQHGKTTQAVAAMTKASELIEAHQAEEQKQGKDLAYDVEQQLMLQTLRETIKGTTGWTAPDLKSVPDIKGASQSVGTGLAFGQFFFGRCSAGQRFSTQKTAVERSIGCHG